MKVLEKLFKRVGNEIMVAVKDDPLAGKTTNEIIEEIHESFYTEVDRLLDEAKISLPVETEYQELIDKSAKLKALGFRSAGEVNTATGEIARMDDLKRRNSEKEDLVEAINHFSMKYPQYKFITEESVKKICGKYNLIYGEVSKYIGTVPDKNIQQMEDFKINKEDACYFTKITDWSSLGASYRYSIISYKKYSDTRNKKDDIHLPYDGSIAYRKSPLEIAAPLKDFNTKGMELKDFKLSKIEIPDPVVLQPVYFKGVKHYLIVTAWGLEASDELVVNQRMN